MAQLKCEDFLAALQREIYELRIEKNETQATFSQRCHLHQSAIARIESGVSPNVGIKTLYEIALGNSIPLYEIMCRAEGMTEGIDDSLAKLESKTRLLSPKKRKWLSKILEAALQDIDSR